MQSGSRCHGHRGPEAAEGVRLRSENAEKPLEVTEQGSDTAPFAFLQKDSSGTFVLINNISPKTFNKRKEKKKESDASKFKTNEKQTGLGCSVETQASRSVCS